MAKKREPEVQESAKEAVDWLRKRLDQKDVPKHQARGPIPFRNGRAYVVCPICTHMFRTRGSIAVAVPKNRQRAHMEAHKLGLVRKPTEVPGVADAV